jgi:hypothetical protein
MALKLAHPRTSNHYRALYENAYHRINEIQINKNDNRVGIQTQIFADKEARDFVPEGGEVGRIHAATIANESFSVTMDEFNSASGADEFAKCYECLKECVAKFADAVDC